MIENSKDSVTYLCDGETQQFTFDARVFESNCSDIKLLVTYQNVTTTITEGYLVELIDPDDLTKGCKVTYPYPTTTYEPLLLGYKVTLLRRVPLTQKTDFQNQGSFQAQTVEDALDKGIVIGQQLQKQIDNSAHGDEVLHNGVDLKLPAPESENVLGWSADGKKIVNYPNAYQNAVTATQKASEAATSASNAQASAVSAAGSASAAEDSMEAAQESEANASRCATSAFGYKNDAIQAATDSASSAQDALSSKNAAAISETNAANSASGALASKNAAKTSEDNAKTSEDNAAGLATAADNSADAAGLSAQSASDSAQAAHESELKAADWAEKETEVETGKFSAKYWAQQSLSGANTTPPLHNNFIMSEDGQNYGGKLSPGTGLQISISALEAIIGRAYQKTTAPTLLGLTARKAAIVYAIKNANGIVPTFDKYDASFPDPDNNTVTQWRINGTGNIPNYAVGRSSIAVANDLVPSGTLTRVDGHCDYAVQSDGSTGYFASQNSTGFPGGSNEVSEGMLITMRLTGADQRFSGAGNFVHNLGVNSSGNFVVINDGGSAVDTGFTVENGMKYYIERAFDGSRDYVYMNGVLVYSAAITRTAAAGTIRIFSNQNSSTLTPSIIHFVEIRNKMRTPAQIAAISNKLCLPVRYNGWLSSYPADPTDAGSHVFKFDDTVANVADSVGAIVGVPSGTSIVDSEIGLGKARSCLGGPSSCVNLGPYAFTQQTTVIFCGKIRSASACLLSNRPNASNGNQFALGTGAVILAKGSSVLIDCSSIGGVFNLNEVNFLAFSINGTAFEGYFNSPVPKIATLSASLDTSSNALYLSQDVANGGGVSAVWEYLAIIPRALSQAEIASYYNVLMKRGERTIVNDCFPVNSLPLGLVRSGTDKPVEIDDSTFRFRNEGATRIEGNKRFWMPWKYLDSINKEISFDVDRYVPPGCPVRVFAYYADDIYGRNLSRCQDAFASGSTYGVYTYAKPNGKQCVFAMAGGVAMAGGSWKGVGGYLTLLVEVV